jgi:hypothetical protein
MLQDRVARRRDDDGDDGRGLSGHEMLERRILLATYRKTGPQP